MPSARSLKVSPRFENWKPSAHMTCDQSEAKTETPVTKNRTDASKAKTMRNPNSHSHTLRQTWGQAGSDNDSDRDSDRQQDN